MRCISNPPDDGRKAQHIDGLRGRVMYMAVQWVHPFKDDAIRCEATTFVMDDRMGGWTNRCELRKGHGGYHRHRLDACDPKAFMAWVGTRHIDGGAGA